MRAAGTSDNSSNYKYGNYFISGGGAVGVDNNSNSNVYAILGSNISTAGFPANVRLEVFSPFLADKTNGVFQTIQPITTGNLNATDFGGFFHNLATSYDSIEFLASTGTFTGNYSVYGYNK
jgi:hypothetical protein